MQSSGETAIKTLVSLSKELSLLLEGERSNFPLASAFSTLMCANAHTYVSPLPFVFEAGLHVASIHCVWSLAPDSSASVC